MSEKIFLYRNISEGVVEQKKKIKEMEGFTELITYNKPKTRGECKKMSRPCLFVSCKHHLYLDISEKTGTIKFYHPEKKIWELEETCALDVADRGGVRLDDIADILNQTKERVRQVESKAIKKMKEICEEKGIDLEVLLSESGRIA